MKLETNMCYLSRVAKSVVWSVRFSVLFR